MRAIPIGGRGVDIATAGGSVWIATPAEGRVWRVDPQLGAVSASVAVSGHPISVTAIGSAVWVGTSQGTLSRIDRRANRVDKVVAIGHPIVDLATAEGRLWARLG